jgi:hypoxanthine phosphoribosyltransferase
MVNALADKIRSDKVEFEVIAGVNRGGLIPAVMLSYNFKKPLITVDPHDPMDIEVLPHEILVVDDIIDTGKTKELLDFYMSAGGPRHFIFTTLIWKPWYWEPDYYTYATMDWIVWPWEIDNE